VHRPRDHILVDDQTCSINTRIALAITKKGDLSISEYVSKIRSLGDNMVNVTKPIDNNELISYILAGLDKDYNSFVTSLATIVESVTIDEAYAQLLSFEHRQEMLHDGAPYHLTNMVNRGRQGPHDRGNFHEGPMEAAAVVAIEKEGATPVNHTRTLAEIRQMTTTDLSANSASKNGRNKTDDNNGPKCQLYFKKWHAVIDCCHRYGNSFVPGERFA
jgi:membrane protease subunit (stomatin/prohibitin family)